MTLGERLRIIRGSLTQAEFATQLGVSQPTIRNYEQENRKPDSDFLNSICYKFEIAPEWLLIGTGPMLTLSVGNKTADVSAVLEEKKPQHTENTSAITKETADTSAFLGAQLELSAAYKATAALQRELTDSIRENADLRVELERQKAQVRDLEREKAALAQKIQEIQQTATEITDMSVVRLAHENEELKSQLARLNRLGIFDEPDTRMPQAGVQDRK